MDIKNVEIVPYFRTMIRVVIIGAGRVGYHMAKAVLKAPGLALAQVYNRSDFHPLFDALPVSRTRDSNQIAKADVYWITVTDDAISNVAESVSGRDGWVVHSSGGQPMDILNFIDKRGVLYPLQSFSWEVKVDMTQIPFCIEATEAEGLEILQKIVHALEAQSYNISSDQRNYLHIAAVFANNFSNHILTRAQSVCREHQIPFKILFPLLRETVSKALLLDPEHAQTGPAARNDTKTIERHEKLLKGSTHLELYQLLTKAIQSYYGKKL